MAIANADDIDHELAAAEFNGTGTVAHRPIHRQRQRRGEAGR